MGVMVTTGATPEEGWYPDPSGTGRRWWDGTGWTHHYQPDGAVGGGDDYVASPETAGQVVSTPSQGAGTIDPVVVAAGGGSLILLLSLFAPWVGTPTAAFNAFASGLPWPLTGGDFEVANGIAVPGTFTSGIAHGWLFLLLALVAGGIAYAHFTGAPWAGNALLGVGAFTILLALLDSFALGRSKLDDLAVDIGPSWGVLIAVLAGILIAAAGALILARDMQPRS